MLEKDTRKGLSLGAIFALISSLFVGGLASPANADENGVILEPAKGTSYTMFITEDFQLKTRLGNNVNPELIQTLHWRIQKAAGFGLSTSNVVGSTEVSPILWDDSNDQTFTEVAGSATESVIAAANTSTTSNGLVGIPTQHVLGLQVGSFSEGAAQPTSLSASVTVTVTAFLDLDNDNEVDSGEAFSTQTVTFIPWATWGATVTLGALSAGGTHATASATLPSTLNIAQLTHSFYINVGGYGEGSAHDAGSRSSAITPGTYLTKASNFVSVSTALTDGVPASEATFNASFYYGTPASGTQVAFTEVESSERTITGVTASAVTGANMSWSDQATGAANSRVNSPYSFVVGGVSGSDGFVDTADTTLTVNSSAGLSTERYVVIEGVTYTDSDDLPSVSGLALTDKTTIDVSPHGFAGGDSLTFVVSAQNYSDTLVVTQRSADYQHVWLDGVANLVAGPGASTTLNYKVVDQFGELSTLTTHRLKAVTSGTGFSTSTAVYASVVAGMGSIAVTTLPATATGSATVTVDLQTLNSDGAYATDETRAITLLVSSSAPAFTPLVNVTDSVSASISYYVADSAYSWSSAITGTVTQAGAQIVVTGTGVYFQNTDTGTSASERLVLRANSSGNFSIKAASKLAGTHVITITMGSLTTTSELVVDPAAGSAGAGVNFSSIANIVPGSTATFTGTLVDANGNGVYTTGSAQIQVTYAGAGIALGAMPTETDVDGTFKVTVLAGSADTGAAALTVTYLKNGASTALADRITAVKNITVGAAAATADQKITVGTFKGYVAIYTKGYMGQKLSAKVAGKWLVVDPIAAWQGKDYSRTVRLTGAGYTIAVDLYIDGAFVRSEVVTTK